MVGIGVVLGLFVATSACGDTRDRGDAGLVINRDAGGVPGRDSGSVITLNDSGAPGGLPRETNGLGALDASCVDFCRDLFATCSRVQVCFFDAGGSCMPQELTASSCATQCAAADSTRAALTAAGCDDEYGAYEVCVASNAAAGSCEIRNEQCGIEWGVYAGCAGL